MTSASDLPYFHLVGVGAGPANLSLAALFDALAPHEMALFEAQPEPGWHSTMLHPGVRMQTGWIKDLVSLVDPTHRLSFLNYLVTTGRVYGLLNAGFETIPRLEYENYLSWAAKQLPRTHYGVAIDQIAFDDGLVCYSQGRPVAHAEHLSLALGTVPDVPPWCAGLDDDRYVIADWLADRLPSMPSDRHAPIAVVGSGQTSAECVQALMGHGYDNIQWIGRRTWYGPLEDSPTANDLYRPAYQQFFLGLSKQARSDLVSGQIMTSDGISSGTLWGLYQANYEHKLRSGRFAFTLMPGRNVVEAAPDGDQVVLRCVAAGGEETRRAAYVVIACGRRTTPLPFDQELREMVDWDTNGEPVIESDYSIRWKRTDRNKIFVMNRGRYVQGLVDSNLSILPVRSAMIINSLAERTVFTVRDDFVSSAWA